MLRKSIRKIIASGLAVLTAVSLAACGGSQGDGNSDRGEFVYVPEYFTIGEEDENSRISPLTYAGGKLYYEVYSYDEASMTSRNVLMKYDPATGSNEEVSLAAEDIPEGAYRRGLAVDDEGNLYVAWEQTVWDEENPDDYHRSIILAKYDASGKTLFSQDITEALTEGGNESYTQYIVSDGEGRICLVCDDGTVRLFDSQGGYKGSVKTDAGWINSAFRGKDGKMYIAYNDWSGEENKIVAAEIDFDGKKLGTSYDLPGGTGNENISAGIEKDFLINSGGKLYEYDIASNTREELLNWMDCDINADYVDMVCAGEDGRLMVLVNDWATGATELAFLTKTKSSEVAEKEEIVVGTMVMNQELQAAAVNFNKSNSKYHITVREYYDYSGDIEYEDALANMNNEIASGNCPDILCLDSGEQDAEKLAAQGVLEDIKPYLEKSESLSLDSFVESVVEGYTYDGALVCIPKNFQIATVAGKTSQVGDKMGWSVQDIMDYAAEHPDAELFEYASRSEMLNIMMIFNQDAFIDWKNGTCNFDSQEFKQILEFVAGFPEEYDWDEDRESTPVLLASGKLLLYSNSIGECQDIQIAEAMFGEPVTYIGYPTIDGSVGCVMGGSSSYGITTKSKHKDGAWAFIEDYLCSDNNMFSWGFPTNKEKLEEIIAEACKVEYVLDENGEPMLDEDGNPIYQGMGGMGWGDWEYTYHPCTEEEIARLRELMDVAIPMSTGNSEVLNIIIEEAEPYFKGAKSLDEVAALIQSRMSMYVGENS